MSINKALVGMRVTNDPEFTKPVSTVYVENISSYPEAIRGVLENTNLLIGRLKDKESDQYPSFLAFKPVLMDYLLNIEVKDVLARHNNVRRYNIDGGNVYATKLKHNIYSKKTDFDIDKDDINQYPYKYVDSVINGYHIYVNVKLDGDIIVQIDKGLPDQNVCTYWLNNQEGEQGYIHDGDILNYIEYLGNFFYELYLGSYHRVTGINHRNVTIKDIEDYIKIHYQKQIMESLFDNNFVRFDDLSNFNKAFSIFNDNLKALLKLGQSFEVKREIATVTLGDEVDVMETWRYHYRYNRYISITKSRDYTGFTVCYDGCTVSGESNYFISPDENIKSQFATRDHHGVDLACVGGGLSWSERGETVELTARRAQLFSRALTNVLYYHFRYILSTGAYKTLL